MAYCPRFPYLQSKGITLDAEVDQHRQIHQGVDRLTEYVTAVDQVRTKRFRRIHGLIVFAKGTEQWSAAELCDIFATFAAVLQEHLHNEVKLLAPENLKKAGITTEELLPLTNGNRPTQLFRYLTSTTEEIQWTINVSPPDQVLPLFLSYHDAHISKSWPLLPPELLAAIPNFINARKEWARSFLGTAHAKPGQRLVMGSLRLSCPHADQIR